jgi:hypothetical protein
MQTWIIVSEYNILWAEKELRRIFGGHSMEILVCDTVPTGHEILVVRVYLDDAEDARRMIKLCTEHFDVFKAEREVDLSAQQ